MNSTGDQIIPIDDAQPVAVAAEGDNFGALLTSLRAQRFPNEAAASKALVAFYSAAKSPMAKDKATAPKGDHTKCTISDSRHACRTGRTRTSTMMTQIIMLWVPFVALQRLDAHRHHDSLDFKKERSNPAAMVHV